jgi:hypothetical protein
MTNKELEAALNAEREAIAKQIEQQVVEWYKTNGVGNSMFRTYTIEKIYALKADGLLVDRMVLHMLEAAANVRARITEVD